jgi:D-serine deaminase-like pyridoxal phosphate-dependent protein
MNIPPLPGTPVQEIETPALLLDLDALEHNICAMNSFFREQPCAVRSVTKGHKCPAIARLQMTVEGAVPWGLSCAKISEAEVMCNAGARKIRMISQVVGEEKLQRLVQLASRVELIALVDDLQQAEQLNSAALAQGRTVQVAIEVDIGIARSGVCPGPEATRLAQSITRLKGVSFVGISAHDGPVRILDRERRETELRRRIQLLLDTRADLERGGFDVKVCAVGSTVASRVAGSMPGITEIEPGSYATMDHGTFTLAPELGFKMAMSVLTTVISRPTSDRAVVDCGHKTIGLSYNGEVPGIIDIPDVSVNRLNAEQGILDLKSDGRQLAIGDRVALYPHYNGSTVNANDYFVCVRGGIVEAIWKIEARGCHQ